MPMRIRDTAAGLLGGIGLGTVVAALLDRPTAATTVGLGVVCLTGWACWLLRPLARLAQRCEDDINAIVDAVAERTDEPSTPNVRDDATPIFNGVLDTLGPPGAVLVIPGREDADFAAWQAELQDGDFAAWQGECDGTDPGRVTP